MNADIYNQVLCGKAKIIGYEGESICLRFTGPRSKKSWYYRGKLHRANGPAVEWDNGMKSWYLYGEYIV